MTESPFDQPIIPEVVPDAADPGEGAPGHGEDLDDHLAADVAGARPHEDADAGDLADELRGRPTPWFRTPHPEHDDR